MYYLIDICSRRRLKYLRLVIDVVFIKFGKSNGFSVYGCSFVVCMGFVSF